jgi:hypothetical protein
MGAAMRVVQPRTWRTEVSVRQVQLFIVDIHRFIVHMHRFMPTIEASLSNIDPLASP